MKKLYAIFLVAVALYTTPAFAEKQYVKYRLSDGEVLALGAMPDLKAGAGEEVSVIQTDPLKEPLYYFTFDRNALTLVRKEDAAIEKIKSTDAFSGNRLLLGLMASFKDEKAIQLAPYLAAVQALATAKQFSDLNKFVSGMVIAGIAKPEDYDIFKGVLFLQGINLDDYPVK